jgi:hypothetical protein
MSKAVIHRTTCVRCGFTQDINPFAIKSEDAWGNIIAMHTQFVCPSDKVFIGKSNVTINDGEDLCPNCMQSLKFWFDNPTKELR